MNKTTLAKELGISRSLLYYKRKQDDIDSEVKDQIEAVMAKNPYYGHKRIALDLKLNKKRILRVMKKYDIKPKMKRKKQIVKKLDVGQEQMSYENIFKKMCPMRMNIVWSTDFTYIKYNNKFIYLATVLDIFTRELVGWSISRYHTNTLIIEALFDALHNQKIQPVHIHSDQGSEYRSKKYIQCLEYLGIKISMSDKASPWQNGHKESFYGKFKLELEDVNNYPSISSLIEAIHSQIYYYNTERIHTALKMSPLQFKQKHRESLSK